MDIVGDFITILRNSSAARQVACMAQWSRLRVGIARILKNNGYVKDFGEERTADGRVFLRVVLKYVNGVPAIAEIGRISRPGRRKYALRGKIPSILGGMGECVLSTSRGVVSGREAQKLGVGGELMCYVF
jgi:small subunit ribosomal protein S8